MGLFEKRTKAERDAKRKLEDVYEYAGVGLMQLAQKARPPIGSELADYLGIAEGYMLAAVEHIASLPPSKYRDELGARALVYAARVHKHAIEAAQAGGISRDQLQVRMHHHAEEAAWREFGAARPA